MKRILRIISGAGHMSQETRNKMYLNVRFKAYEDTFSDTSASNKRYSY